MSDTFLMIPVTAETHAEFYAKADALGIGADSFVRQLLNLDRVAREIVGTRLPADRPFDRDAA